MTSEDRLLAALSAPAAPAKDMHFALEVMRRAEATRFRADAARRVLRGAGLAVLGAGALILASGWAAENADALLNGVLALAVGWVGIGLIRRRIGARA